ncbi:hypothetical protein [Streptomyces nojiriensis]|uniref:hypothetical protein n=1 Tax=Streptomyces nojiriensis TaxID=66374 RepID=UPI003665D4E8
MSPEAGRAGVLRDADADVKEFSTSRAPARAERARRDEAVLDALEPLTGLRR